MSGTGGNTVGYLLAVPDGAGQPLCAHFIEERWWALTLMDKLNLAQYRWDGTKPWHVFPVGEHYSNDHVARRNRETRRGRAG